MGIEGAFAMLEESLQDPEALSAAYDSLMTSALALPIWYGTGSVQPRMHWRSIGAARRVAPRLFDSPGLYIFGAADKPRYVGMTTTTLWKRLNGRHIRGKRAQFVLADTYTDAIGERGLAGFPQQLRDWCLKRCGTLVRLEGAVDLARYGIAEAWILPVPAASSLGLRSIEAAVIPIANQWNLQHGLPSLINKDHVT